MIINIYLTTEERSIKEGNTVHLESMKNRYIENNLLGGPRLSLDFLPKWASFDSDIRLKIAPVIYPGTHPDSIRNLKISGSKMNFNLIAEYKLSIIIPWYYFPGWKAYINGRQVKVGFDENGFVQIIVPPGSHEIKIFFGTTWPRIIGWFITGISTLVVFLFLTVFFNRKFAFFKLIGGGH